MKSTAATMRRLTDALDDLSHSAVIASYAALDLAAALNAMRERLLARLTCVQREDLDALEAAGVPWLDAYVIASKPGRWFVRRPSRSER